MSETGHQICLECGARFEADYPTCLHYFERTIVELSNRPHWRGELRMAMDSYALQHMEQFCPHRRSVAVHLMGLCWILEWNGEAKVAKAMQRWLETQRDLPELPPPFISPFQEVVCISDVMAAYRKQDDTAFIQEVRIWGKSVWAIWHEHHPVVRRWIAAAVNH